VEGRGGLVVALQGEQAKRPELVQGRVVGQLRQGRVDLLERVGVVAQLERGPAGVEKRLGRVRDGFVRRCTRGVDRLRVIVRGGHGRPRARAVVVVIVRVGVRHVSHAVEGRAVAPGGQPVAQPHAEPHAEAHAPAPVAPAASPVRVAPAPGGGVVAAPVAVDPAIVIPTVGVEPVGPEGRGTIIRPPAHRVAIGTDGPASAADVSESPAARRGALNSIDSAPRYAAAGSPGAHSRRAVVDRSSPRRVVRSRARAVIDLTSAHSLCSSSTSVAHARAVALVRAARAERGRPAERFHAAIAPPGAPAITTTATETTTTATETTTTTAATTTTAEAVERRDLPAGEQNRKKRDERDK